MIQALTARRADCVAQGRRHDWEACVEQFVAALVGGDGRPVSAPPAFQLPRVA